MALSATDGSSSVRWSPPPPPPPPQQPAPATVPVTAYQPEPAYHPQLQALAPYTTGAGPAGQTFADYVDGQRAQSIDLQLMEIANAAYDPNVDSVGDWTRVDDATLQAAGIDPALFETPETGFRAGLYTDGNGNYVLGFSGSNATWQDWVDNNFAQGLGFFAEQYDQAPALMNLVGNSTLGDPTGQSTLFEREALVATGHSLGGGLAATAALAAGVPAVTYDAAGVHDATFERLGLDPGAARQQAEDGQVRRYNVAGDPLTAAQEDVPLLNGIPDAPGHEITLDDPLPPIPGPDLTDWPWEVAENIADYARAKAERVADLHRQGTMIEALQEQRPWE